jgi:NitT/TauT family transport system substrate-binding protein
MRRENDISFVVRVLGCIAFMATLCATAQAEPVKIRIQYADPTTHLTPIAPMTPAGVLRHLGKSYVMDPIFIQGSTPALTALAAGELELAALGSQSFALAVGEAKLDVRAIAQVITVSAPGRDPGYYWVRTGEITKVEQLKGKVVATNARGGTVHAGSLLYLKRHGLEEGRDYQTVELRFPAMLPALLAGKADLVFLVEPFDRDAASNPAVAKLFSVADSLGPFETGFWVGKASWIAANRAALVDLCEDMILFRKWAYDPKTSPEARALLAKVGKRPVEDYAKVFTAADTLHRDPKLMLDADNVQRNIRDLNEAGAMNITIEAKNYVDMSLAKEAAARIDARR